MEVTNNEELEQGTLAPDEWHPAAMDAKSYILNLGLEKQMQWLGTFASTSLSGNRLGEVCAETLRRVMECEPVSDRYLLGLCWTILRMEKEVASEGIYSKYP